MLVEQKRSAVLQVAHRFLDGALPRFDVGDDTALVKWEHDLVLERGPLLHFSDDVASTHRGTRVDQGNEIPLLLRVQRQSMVSGLDEVAALDLSQM